MIELPLLSDVLTVVGTSAALVFMILALLRSRLPLLGIWRSFKLQLGFVMSVLLFSELSEIFLPEKLFESIHYVAMFGVTIVLTIRIFLALRSTS